MSWKEEFDSNELSEGRDLFKQGCVSNLKYKGNIIKAKVESLRGVKQRVIITYPDEVNMAMSCDCFFGKVDGICSHMAAVLYAWEESTKKNESGSVLCGDEDKIYNEMFPDAPEGFKPYFDIKTQIAPFKPDGEVIFEAKRLLDEKKIKLKSVDEVYLNIGFREDREYPSLYALAEYEHEYLYRSVVDHNVVMLIKRGEPDDIVCPVCGHSVRRFYYETEHVICPHMLASLSLLTEYLRTHDLGDNTDSSADRFIDSFRREKKKQLLTADNKKSGKVILIPSLSYEQGSLQVGFKISNTGRAYIVKNITELYDAVNEKKLYSLGKNCKIDFAIESFDESSSEIFGIIEQSVKDLEAMDKLIEKRLGRYYDMPSVEAKKSIAFHGSVVDKLYKACYGKKIECPKLYENGPKELSVMEALPSVYVNIKADKKNDSEPSADLLVSGDIPLIAEGVEKDYFFDKGVFSAIDEETAGFLQPFRDSCKDKGEHFSFRVGYKHAAEFYYRILPLLREYAAFEIETDDDIIEKSIISEASFVFYLDAEEGGICCKAVVKYYDAEYTLFPGGSEGYLSAAGRDSLREAEVLETLEGIFDQYSGEKQEYVLYPDDDQLYDFLRNGLEELLEIGEVNSTEAFSGIRIKRSFPVQLGVSVKSDIMNLELLTEDIDPEELSLILTSYRKKKKYHRLRSGEFINLEGNDAFDTFAEMMDSLGVDEGDITGRSIDIPSYRALYLDSLLEAHEELAADRDRIFRNLIRNFKTINDSEFEAPEALKGVLRPYQEYGFKWMKTLETAGFGGILADDMGLGKTLQLITLLSSFKEKNGVVNALIVCPASLVYNWLEEIKRFAPDMSAEVVAGTPSVRKSIIEAYKDTDILVTSYDLLKRDVERYSGAEFTHLALDEAQFIKNAGAIAAKSVKLINAAHRFALTGTPIENRLSELWSIFDFLMPGFLYSYQDFKKRFEKPISKDSDETATEVLKKHVSPFILRRKKVDVLKDLPEKTEEVLHCVMDDKQQRLYDAQVVHMKELIAVQGEDFNKNKIQILAELTRIRQICCDPGLLFEDFDGGSAKREMCTDLVKSVTESGHKMLLFSQFTSMLALIEEDLKAEGINYFKITGETPKEDRLRLVKTFNADETPVFLISLKAGGTGLNLTGADIVIHYDPWWNTAAQDQATDRAHRIGQTKKVTVYKLIVKGTIEEKIIKLQETKKELADSVLSGETRSLGSMDKEELLEILG